MTRRRGWDKLVGAGHYSNGGCALLVGGFILIVALVQLTNIVFGGLPDVFILVILAVVGLGFVWSGSNSLRRGRAKMRGEPYPGDPIAHFLRSVWNRFQ